MKGLGCIFRGRKHTDMWKRRMFSWCSRPKNCESFNSVSLGSNENWYFGAQWLVTLTFFMDDVGKLHCVCSGAERSPKLIRKPKSWFSHGCHSSGIARRRVRTAATATVESRNMAVILQIMGWQRYVALVYCLLLTFQNKVSAYQYHVTISWAQVHSSSKSSVFFKMPLTKCWFFDWIAGSCLVNLMKTGQDCSEAG